MIKAFYSQKISVGEIISLSDEESHHIFRVLRAQNNESILLLNGAGIAAEAHVLPSQKIIVDKIISQKPLEIILYASLIKSKAMDFVIREATAIGVREIVSVYTKHSEVKITDTEHKIEHWRNIAREACKQSGNAYLPKIEAPQNLTKIQFQQPTFVAALHDDAKTINHYYSEIQSHTVGILIGPEGDFSDEEYAFLSQQGIHFITLGSHVLRSEIATLYLLSVVDQIKMLSSAT